MQIKTLVYIANYSKSKIMDL